ncbi:putative phosphoglycerate kinase [Firmicutes bacterium CAG:475]|nr:putative phosphoglycerate kinase [Firmicutes bacterium CAG:475]
MRIFKNAHRTVPNDGLCALDCGCKEFLRLGTDVKTFSVGRYIEAVAIFDVDVCVDGIGETCASCGIDGKINGLAEGFCLFEHLVAVFDLFVVNERKTYAAALSLDKCVCHTTADDKRVAFVEEIVDDVEFVCHLCAAENRNEGTDGIFNCVSEEFEFLFNEETADCHGCETVLNDTCGGCVSAVCGAECVVDVDVAEISEFSAKLFAVFLFACVETSVFQKHDFAVFEGCNFLVCVLTHKVCCKRNFAGEMLCKFVGNGLQSEFLGIVFESFCDVFRLCSGLFAFGKSLNRLLFFFVKTETFGENVVRFAHVGAKDNFCAVVYEILDGGKCAVDTVFVGDNAVNHRNVEVATNQTLFALDVYVADCHFCHRYSPLRKLIFVCQNIFGAHIRMCDSIYF